MREPDIPVKGEAEVLDAELLKRFPLPHHPDDGDKEERGRLLVIAGSRELPGAALLAGVGALRAGAGKLQIATAASVAVQIGAAVPESRVIGLKETEAGCIAESEVDRLLEWAGAAQAVLLGCGLQHGAPLDVLLDRLLGSGLEVPLVLDAAVLGSLPERSDALKGRSGPSILLPHAGEMARLLGCERDEVAADPLRAARRAAETYGTVTLVKGEHSHVVAPDGRAFRFRGGGVGLATSGSGDTLAGIVGGLAARGADPLTALLWGVYLHGEAGRTLSTRVGRVGFLARELLDLVPGMMDQ
jgi:ADP-dependent NAD(P)H-hydrate dehydratase